ncbi:unnamed protein product [Nesidiocoris tenuis]|uniref:Uncharacterized protein n=1 Tax=Nesidiocoris tenuis TaxID=355587 RepID=A0A6H5FT57_9HEMI|nr:unnamed protein product [Nesidiocoris tenuis]
MKDTSGRSIGVAVSEVVPGVPCCPQGETVARFIQGFFVKTMFIMLYKRKGRNLKKPMGKKAKTYELPAPAVQVPVRRRRPSHGRFEKPSGTRRRPRRPGRLQAERGRRHNPRSALHGGQTFGLQRRSQTHRNAQTRRPLQTMGIRIRQGGPRAGQTLPHT